MRAAIGLVGKITPSLATSSLSSGFVERIVHEEMCSLRLRRPRQPPRPFDLVGVAATRRARQAGGLPYFGPRAGLLRTVGGQDRAGE